MGELTFLNGEERLTMSCGENADDTVYVRQVSEGDLTQRFFDCDRYVVTVTFRPSEQYGIEDVEDDFARRRDDCFITDYEDTLNLWGVKYAETHECVMLAA